MGCARGAGGKGGGSGGGGMDAIREWGMRGVGVCTTGMGICTTGAGSRTESGLARAGRTHALPLPIPQRRFRSGRVRGSMGMVAPRSYAILRAFSYPASAWRKIPMRGSLVSTRLSLSSASGVPSATMT